MLAKGALLFLLLLLTSCSESEPDLPCQYFIDNMSLTNPLVREHLISWSNEAIHNPQLWKELADGISYDSVDNSFGSSDLFLEMGIDWDLLGFSPGYARLELVGSKSDIDYRNFSPSEVSEVRLGLGGRGYAAVHIMPKQPLHKEIQIAEKNMISHSFSEEFSVRCWGPFPGD